MHRAYVTTIQGLKMNRAYVTTIQGMKMHRAYVTTIQGTKRPFCLNAHRLTDIAAFPIVSRVAWPLNYLFMHISKLFSYKNPFSNHTQISTTKF